MDYRILGPLEVSDGDCPLALGGEKQRALLAVLLLHAGEVVSADCLIDDLWGERPPPGAVKALQAHVSRLRKALDANGDGLLGAGGDASGTLSKGTLVTRGHGYALRVEPGELDLDRFQALVEEGRKALADGDPERAAETLRAGLALWRGPPLADFTYETFAQAPIAQLQELRLGAVEERVEADLALGRHEQLVGELAAMVKQNPLRERLRMQLMLALYRSDRQAEALDVYQEFRRGLAEELGLDPSPRLQQLEAAILNRDASLALPASGATDPHETAGSSALPVMDFAVQRRGVKLALASGTLLALAVIAAVIASDRSGANPTTIGADSVGAISPGRGALTADVPVGSSPSSVAAGEGAVWVTNYSAGTVSRIDPATRAVVQTIPVDSTPSAVAVGAGAVDRSRIANLVRSAAQPTCQFLTPYIPGYQRYCPYTLSPNSTGVWRAPNLAIAERLIAASHTRGTAITLLNFGIGGDAAGVGRYLVSLLDSLGYRAGQRNLISETTAASERFADSRNRAQVALGPYFPNYPAASEYIKWFLSCQNFLPNSTSNSNWAQFCDTRLDAQIRRALAAQESDSPAAPDLWAQADKTVTNDAPLVPLVLTSTIDFVSRRVGNYQYSPQLGGTALIDQLWVK